jgi:hypothetical protein
MTKSKPSAFEAAVGAALATVTLPPSVFIYYFAMQTDAGETCVSVVMHTKGRAVPEHLAALRETRDAVGRAIGDAGFRVKKGPGNAARYEFNVSERSTRVPPRPSPL